MSVIKIKCSVCGKFGHAGIMEDLALLMPPYWTARSEEGQGSEEVGGMQDTITKFLCMFCSTPEKFPEVHQERALRAVYHNPKLHGWLQANDPKLMEQIREALGIPV